MNRKKEKTARRAGVGTGTTSLLVIFTVLCMATLALLSLTTAVSNRRINERSFSGVQNLAVAEGNAAIKLSNVDELLFELQQQPFRNDEEYLKEAMEILSKQGYTVDTDTKMVYISLPIDERLALITELELSPLSNSASRYTIVAQVSVLQKEWVPEEGGEYWSGT